MDTGILTGIITAAVLGGVFILLYISSKGHKSKDKKPK
jgi:hypothetical protein